MVPLFSLLLLVFNVTQREGWIESKLRFLIQNLEQTPNVKYAMPNPTAFPCNYVEKDTTIWCTSFFMGLILDLSSDSSSGPKTINLTPAVSEFVAAVKEWPSRTPTMDIRVKYVRR